MPEKPKLVNITMARANLDDIPECPLVEPYALRLYREGDGDAFDDIWTSADDHGQAYRGLFEKEFRANIDEVPGRMYFLLDGGGEPVGTATAWFNNDWEGGRWGVVHWVGIKPAHQGRGLARPLMAQVLKRFGELGHERAYLITQTLRLPAINLYTSFGFEPFITTAEDKSNWREVRENLAALRR